MPIVPRKLKRFLAVGCSHGDLADQDALDAVLRFKKDFKPDFTVHLGDFLDTAALRSGAKGTGDEGRDLDADLCQGLLFLADLRPNLVLCGNHEARVWRLTDHPNAIVAKCAGDLQRSIRSTCKRLGAELVEYRGIWEKRKIANYSLMHGYLYTENAARDHAEAHGNVIFAHTHRAGMAIGRRDDDAMGLCVGTLADIPNMDYANTRRATLGWSQGFVWGEYCDSWLQPFLHIKQKTANGWVLP